MSIHASCRVFGCVAAAALLGCEPASEDDARRSLAADTAERVRSAEVAALEVLSFDPEALPPNADVTGDVVDGARWRDANGENVVVLAETGEFPAAGECDVDHPCRDAEIRAYHFARNGAAWKRLWLVTDFERTCGWDLTARFVKGSLSVTDLDHDGVGESTFLYTLTCTSDVSPSTLKLIMHEGQAKYAIRGTTDLSAVLGKSEYSGGDRNVDPAFGRAHARQRSYALAQWERFVKPEYPAASDMDEHDH
ncbi:M949_RS01915 family surface polysaccharide biosynthesis protein [Longimicrobium sp.]|jgi:hypothetical protein|uniref:M949_RS01915 family surface polysaccharide biosynthesis protein n=1 Tax=Longimicrobium sp. TaxID=2029185 RepID=UPI002ED98AFE